MMVVIVIAIIIMIVMIGDDEIEKCNDNLKCNANLSPQRSNSKDRTGDDCKDDGSDDNYVEECT